MTKLQMPTRFYSHLIKIVISFISVSKIFFKLRFYIHTRTNQVQAKKKNTFPSTNVNFVFECTLVK